MGKYNTSKKDKKLRRLEKKIKKKYFPKKGLSAYLYYCQERRITLKKEQPGLENREVVAVMSKEWNSLTPEQKEPYIKKQKELIKFEHYGKLNAKLQKEAEMKALEDELYDNPLFNEYIQTQIELNELFSTMTHIIQYKVNKHLSE